MDFVEQKPGLTAVLAFIAGVFIGLVVLGWWLWPVQYTGARMGNLVDADQDFYVRSVSELYAFDRDQDKVQTALGGWAGDVVACRLAAATTDAAEVARLTAVAQIVNGQGCTGIDTAAAAAEESGGGTSIAPFLLVLLLLVLVGAILYVFNRRSQMMGGSASSGGVSYAEVPEAAPMQTGSEEITAVPIARFRTSYGRGHDTYDDSFSIENSRGDFLGECGVGISESIGTDSPKNVTAIEVWLFDKNDIRTITKVIMSDHAFFDDALKAKLAPKGEPVLARENETIVLETATLIINAEITELEYGDDNVLPPQSYFDRFTIELSAWAKEGDFDEPDIEGRVDELMNY